VPTGISPPSIRRNILCPSPGLERKASTKPQLGDRLLLSYDLACYLTQKIKVLHYSETSVNVSLIIQGCNQEILLHAPVTRQEADNKPATPKTQSRIHGDEAKH
jgi:hypothetical protein